MKSKKTIMIIILSVVVIGGGFWFWTRGGISGKANSANTPANAEAKVMPAVKVSNEVVADGVVVPLQKSALSLPVGGIVAQVF